MCIRRCLHGCIECMSLVTFVFVFAFAFAFAFVFVFVFVFVFAFVFVFMFVVAGSSCKKGSSSAVQVPVEILGEFYSVPLPYSGYLYL